MSTPDAPTPPAPVWKDGYYPPGGWSLSLPDGMALSRPTRKELEAAVAGYLDVSPEEARDFVEAKLCARFPSYCFNTRESRPSILTLPDRASMMLTSLENANVSVNEPSLIEARLRICKACPSNLGLTIPGCCGRPGALAAFADAVCDDHKIPKVNKGWCGVLGYNLHIAAHLLPVNHLVYRTDPAHDRLPLNCPYRAKDHENP